jgi:hypothetical protein
MAVSRLKHLPLKKEWVLVIVILVIIIAAAGSGGYYFSQTQKGQSIFAPFKSASDDQLESVVSQVGKLMVLPNETPQLATVSDVTKLANQPFFTHAQNGDKVLIYQNAKKAILYRPSVNKIIEVAPVNIPSSTPVAVNTNPSVTPSTSLSPTPTSQPVKIVILNGTNTVGLTKQVESSLNGKVNNIDVVDRTNAKDNTYNQTIVVVLNSGSKKTAQSIADALNAKVEPLPKDETKPANADILIIAGSNLIK